MLSRGLLMLLLKTLEEPPAYVIFIFIGINYFVREIEKFFRFSLGQT